MTPEETEALKIAREMIDAGVPVFAAAPNPDRPGEYYLPAQWQHTRPDPAQLDRWLPGWALGAVGGHVADFLDADPRNGGDQSLKELEIQGQVPRVFGVQSTPSGGTHLVISLTGERKATGFMPGLDLQSGRADGIGRGFIYIAPTVRPSKAPETLGELRPYRWEQPPDLAYLREFRAGADDTLDGVLARVHTFRASERPVGPAGPSNHDPLFMQGGTGGPRAFTLAEAQAFCLPHLEALEQAQIGSIEESANRAAVALAHFVPALWSADQAYDVLMVALNKTAYDPRHPASGWTAEKFRAVLDGRRPPLDGWKAVKRDEISDQGADVVPSADAVDALIAEMLSADEISERSAPRPLIKGLLNLDSIAWTIGAPGSKKSFVVLSQAAHIARGLPWLGLKVQQGAVVMIVAEGAGGMSTRVRAWQRMYGPIGGKDVFRVLPRPVQVSDVSGWQVLVEACRRIQPVMVVIDTQARVTVGMEENSAKEMGVFVEAAERIRQATGACVNVVHHTGRNGADARGSSAIDGAQSTEIKIVRQDALTGVLKVEKQKDLEEREDMPLYFERVVVGQDEDGGEVSSLVLIEANEFRRAEGRDDPNVDVEPWRGRQPEGWTATVVAPQAKIKRRILQALHDHARGRGLVASAVRSIVTDRWEKVSDSGWHDAWTAVLDLDCVVSAGGERFTLDVIGLDLKEE